MFRSVCLLLILLLCFAILTCKNKTVEPGVRPGAIRLIPHSADTDWTEKGIDADSETDGIFISWFSPEEDDIDYVEIYRCSEDETVFEQLTKIYAPDTSYVDTKVTFHKRYFYYVISVNEDGLKGVSSDTLFYTLLEKATDLIPKGNVDSTIATFSWRDPNLVYYAVLKFKEAATEEPVWMTTVVSDDYSERMECTYNFTNLKRNTDYLWRVDIVGTSQTNSGSETSWTLFTIN